MGCSLCKELESPSKRPEEAWNAVLPKAFAAQLDRNFRTTADGGYIAAIISANYGSLNRLGPVKAPESDDPRIFSQGNCSHQKGGTMAACIDGSPASKLGSFKHNDEMVVAEKLAGGARGELETIDIWELMQGLDDYAHAQDFNNSDDGEEDKLSKSVGESSLVKASRPDPNLNCSVEKACGSLEWHIGESCASREVSNASVACRRSTARREELARLVRPKSFTVVESSFEHIHIHAASRKSRTPPPEWATSWGTVNGNHTGNTCKERTQSASKSRASGNECPPALSHLVFEKAMGSEKDCGGVWKHSDSRRALSFKYIFSNSESQDTSKCSGNSKMNANGSANALQSRLMNEDEAGASCISSPEFSASLKDWLPDNRPSTQPIKSSQEAVSSPNCIHCKYAGGGPDASNWREEVAKGFPGDRGTITGETPMFDPDLLESFEKAIQQLSEEEWNAVQSMEDSPRHFVSMLNPLQRSNTSQMCRRRAKGDATHDSAISEVGQARVALRSKPLSGDMNHIKQSAGGRKPPLGRQSSWELKRATVMGGRRDNELSSKVVFFSSTSQGDAKVYDDCNAVRAILRSLMGSSFDERVVSQNSSHEEELKAVLGIPTVVVPTIVVKGKYLVGVDSILQLHRKGILGSLLKAALFNDGLECKSSKFQCICRGGKFLVCPLCKGRRKLIRHGDVASVCWHCSGTGLIKCSNCSS